MIAPNVRMRMPKFSMGRSKAFAPVSVFVLGTLLPAIATACPMCFSGNPRIRAAFFSTTVLLSLLPLGMIGCGLVWLHRTGKLSFRDEFIESDELPKAPAPAQASTTQE